MVALNLASEMERRDVGPSELARLACVSRASVARMRAGSPGRAATRRALRTALAKFEPVAELNESPAAAPAEGVEQALDLNLVQVENQRRREEMERLREGPR